MHTRLRLRRKVVVGHWSDAEVQERIGAWARVDARLARSAGRQGRALRRQHAPGRGHRGRQGRGRDRLRLRGQRLRRRRSRRRRCATSATRDVDALCRASTRAPTRWRRRSRKGGAKRTSLRDGARIELGLRAFLEDGGFKGFTTTFEDLHGLAQLPGPRGAAADGRRLRLRRRGRLEDGGAAARDEGDGRRPATAARRSWRTTPTTCSRGSTRCSARTCWRSARRSPPASRRSKCIRSASAARPIRCGWCSTRRRARRINASLVDLGGRFRLIVNEVDAVKPPKLPKLPVARAVWECRPDFKTACAAWIHAGGAHHTGYSYAVTTEHIEDFAEIAGVELVDHRRRDRRSAPSRPSCATTRSTTPSPSGFHG